MNNKFNKSNGESTPTNQTTNKTSSPIEEKSNKLDAPDLQMASKQDTISNLEFKDDPNSFKKQNPKNNRERDEKSKVIPKKTIITVVIIILLLLLIMSLTLGIVISNNNKEYTVKFYSDSVEITELEQKVVNGKTIVMPTFTPTKAGDSELSYVFDNWYIDANFTELFDFSTPITGDITLYAKFIATINTYTVSFISDEGSDIQTLEYGSKIIKPADPATNPDNAMHIAHTFNGWFTEPIGGEKFDFDTSTISSNITLYAQYSKEDLLTYERLANGNYKVTGINPKANKATLTNIIIPSDTSTLVSENVTEKDALIVEIDKGILIGCNALTEITIPFVGATLDGSLSPLFGYLFGANEYIDHETVLPTSLKTVHVAGGEIWGDCFSNILSIETVTLPNGIEYIGYAAFGETASLKNIIIPESVKTIEDLAFFGSKALTHINIPKSVQTIGNSAFESSELLESITILSEELYVGSQAFLACKSLKTFNVPGKVSHIGIMAFRFSGIESVNIAGGVDVIDREAFTETENLKYFSFENGVRRMEYRAFFYGPIFTDIVLPNNLEYLGDSAFGDCDELKSVTIPGDVKVIENSAFVSCNNLKQVIMNDGITEISNDAFASCISLAEIVIPNTVTSIGNSAFYSCTALKTVTLKSGLTNIGNFAFNGCSSLEFINIPASVTTIGFGIFNNCNALKSINVDFQSQAFRSEGNCVINNSTNSVVAGCNISIIPNGILSIEKYAFSKCNIMTTIQIPDTVTIIGESAFRECENLTSMMIPSSVTTIGVSAFEKCPALSSVTGMAGVTTISDKAFYECAKIVNIDIPQSIEYIGKEAFRMCIGLESVSGMKGVLIIDAQAFEGCSSLKNIEISEGLQRINNKAFNGCVKLESINLPESLIIIGYDAFNSCKSLTSITIPRGVRTIYDNTFSGCENLRLITIKNGVTKICDRAFNHIYNAKIYIPSSVKTIDNNAFNVIDETTVIYCEATNKPDGWHENWKDSSYCKATIVWGATMPTTII